MRKIPTDTLAMLGASVAIEFAGLPFNGPIGAVRVGRIEGRLVANPSYAQIAESDIDLVVSGTESSIMMVEAGCRMVSEKDVLAAIDYAHHIIKRQVEAQRAMLQSLGISKRKFEAPPENTALKAIIAERASDKLKESMAGVTDKAVRAGLIDEAMTSVKNAIAELPDEDPLKQESASTIAAYLELHEAELMRAKVLDTGVRADGRRCDEIRPITVESSILPRAHGSALFTRGTTQVLSVARLASVAMHRGLDSIEPVKEKRYMHHYNFPGYSVGEVKPNRGPGRREIGHGALAERALLPVLPGLDVFPYTIRVVSEVLESNGSTSMASTCGSSSSSHGCQALRS